MGGSFPNPNPNSHTTINGGDRDTMKCKIHPSEPSPGVCATCLRERLTKLSDADFSSDRRRYLVRSASSDNFGLRPTIPIHRRETPAVDQEHGVRRIHFRRFTFFSDLLLGHFRHRETESNTELNRPSRSRSWLSAMIRGKGRRKNKNKNQKKKQTPEIVVIGRGMSPAEKEEFTDYESESGYQTEPPLKGPRDSYSPMRLAEETRYSRFTGLSLCFSPLMRPSPGNRWSQAPSEVGFSGELRGNFNAQRQRYGGAGGGGSSVLGQNRSKKIADFEFFDERSFSASGRVKK